MKVKRLTDHATAGARPRTAPDDLAPTHVRIANLVAILVPVAGLVAAIALVWPFGFNWLHLALLLGMYVLTGLGVTIGYHRLFTHKSFETGPVMKFIIGALGSMAVEGPVLHWVADHRRHHQHSDSEDDPHSPHVHGKGVWNILRGLWHAHMGWILSPRKKDLRRYVPDLQRDRVVRIIHHTFPLWVALGLVIPTAIGGLITMTWTGALLGLLWGGLVRVLVVHHATWSINSVCHMWGARPFDSHDESRNNVICAILGFGEGWHNNHHAFPASARHGLRWWELDTSYLIIKGMEMVGLARNVRVPAPQRIVAKRRTRG
jgi:stearoyl-CoA desaturase (delta-9 desaturase)